MNQLIFVFHFFKSFAFSFPLLLFRFLFPFLLFPFLSFSSTSPFYVQMFVICAAAVCINKCIKIDLKNDLKTDLKIDLIFVSVSGPCSALSLSSLLPPLPSPSLMHSTNGHSCAQKILKNRTKCKVRNERGWEGEGKNVGAYVHIRFIPTINIT